MTNDRLTLFQIAVLTAYSMGMSAGQVLFKVAANRSDPERQLGERLLDLVQDGYFLAALVLYAGFAVLWVWILSVTPLSRAYPFVALAFVLTPLLGGAIFGEAISVRLLGGIALILCGLFLVTS
jgi:drug/metabolite transporter (DMT)-like permease